MQENSVKLFQSKMVKLEDVANGVLRFGTNMDNERVSFGYFVSRITQAYPEDNLDDKVLVGVRIAKGGGIEYIEFAPVECASDKSKKL